jgi:hypothetical protein
MERRERANLGAAQPGANLKISPASDHRYFGLRRQAQRDAAFRGGLPERVFIIVLTDYRFISTGLKPGANESRFEHKLHFENTPLKGFPISVSDQDRKNVSVKQPFS